MVFRALQRVMVGRVTRVKFISSRTGYVNYGRRASSIVHGVVLVLFPFFWERAYVVTPHHGAVLRRGNVRAIRVFFHNAMSSSALVLVPFRVVWSAIIHLFSTLTISRARRRVQAIGSYRSNRQVLRVRAYNGVLLSTLYNNHNGYASGQAI